MEALLGLLGGGVARLLPEVFKFLDRGNERKHEKEMFSLNLEADKLKSQNELAVISAQSEAALGGKDLEALIAGVQAQAQPTGVAWVDAINSLVRPLITYWFLAIFSTVKVSAVILLVKGGVPFSEAVPVMWGPEDSAIFSSIISYWFMDRTLRKGGGVR